MGTESCKQRGEGGGVVTAYFGILILTDNREEYKEGVEREGGRK